MKGTMQYHFASGQINDNKYWWMNESAMISELLMDFAFC
jgi:hypothetical protein